MRNETNVRESKGVAQRLCAHQQEISLAEQTMSQQCQEMGRLLKDLKQKYQGSHSHCLAELEVLRMGNDCLQQIVAERDQQLGELHQQLTALPQEHRQDETHLAELHDLREHLKEKEALIEQLQAARQETTASSFTDDHDYEAELTDFPRQLEADRQGLNKELEQLRSRNPELPAAARDAARQLPPAPPPCARHRADLTPMRPPTP